MKAGLMLGVNPNSEREENDYYATNPKALTLFLEQIKKDGVILNGRVWECACGGGHLMSGLKKEGYSVVATDVVDRGCGADRISDFLTEEHIFSGDILTNPPFKLAEKFIEKGMELLPETHKLFLFLKIQFLEGQKRKELFKKYPPKYVYCYSARQQCSKNADFEKYKATTQFYAWYVWEKGFYGETILRWI